MLKLTLAIAVLLLPAAAVAEIYQWKDTTGRIHYSDQPPPAAARQERIVTPRIAPAPASADNAPASAPARADQDQEAAFRQRQVEQEEVTTKKDKDQSMAQERARNCELAQGNLKNLQVGGRHVRYDPKTGERVYLSDDEISQSIKDAQRSVDEWCKPVTAKR